MIPTCIRVGDFVAYPLNSGGWMCSRPGDDFPVWRCDAADAARLLRAWLPSPNFPPTGESVWPAGARLFAAPGGRGLARSRPTRVTGMEAAGSAVASTPADDPQSGGHVPESSVASPGDNGSGTTKPSTETSGVPA